MLERLDRVEQLHLAGAPATTLLGELRALVAEAEDWLAAEGTDAEAAEAALDRCREALGTHTATRLG